MKCFQLKLVVIFLLTVLLLSACQDKGVKAKLSQEIFATAAIKTKVSTLRFSGEIEPLRESVVIASADGVVSQLLFKFGEEVSKGKTLVEIKSSQLQKNFDETLTAYLKAKDALAVEKAIYIGSQKLWAAGLIAKNTYDADKSTLYSSELSFVQAKNKLQMLIEANQIKHTKGLLDLNLADIDKVKKALNQNTDKTTLVAPIAGVLLLPPKVDSDKEIHLGSHVKESDVLALIGDLSGFVVRVKVSEVDVDKLAVGMKAQVTGVSFQGQTLEGEVTQVNAQALSGTASSGLPQFGATIRVKNIPDVIKKHIRIGMSADITIHLNESHKLVVPTKALHHDALATWVNKKEAGRCVKQLVATGQPFAGDVAIISGLKAGDKVCL